MNNKQIRAFYISLIEACYEFRIMVMQLSALDVQKIILTKEKRKENIFAL